MTTAFDPGQARRYLDQVAGQTPGFLAMAVGRQPYRSDTGRYAHRSWQEYRIGWPADRDRMLADLARLCAGADVYVCPAVRRTDARHKGDAAAPGWCWVDLDGAPADTALWDELAPLVVRSGQPGHRHAYIPLSVPVDVAAHARLNKTLAARLGGDAKWSDEALLRLPGTLNFKPATPGEGRTAAPPAPVELEAAPGRVWAPDALADLLSVDLSAPEVSATQAVEGEPVDLGTLPQSVADRLADTQPRNRSGAAYALTSACFDAGLSHGQAVTLAEDYPPAIGKFGGRSGGVAGDVANSWAKLEKAAGPEPTWLIEGRPPTHVELFMASPRWTAMAAQAGIDRPPTAASPPQTAAPAVAPVRRVVHIPASTIKPRRSRWLWAQRIPLGELSLLGGREGIGKSTVAYQLAADITRGRLPGEHFGAPKAVVVMATEDSWEHTVVPRLMAAGADTDRVHQVSVRTEHDVETGLNLPWDLAGLKSVIEELGAVLVLLDPLMSRLDSRLDTHKDADVRRHWSRWCNWRTTAMPRCWVSSM